MLHRWEERWEHLQLSTPRFFSCFYIFLTVHFCSPVLEVYQFARDAAVAEGWLMAQESYLTSSELGVSFDPSNSPLTR